MKRILITGGAGFIGGHLRRILETGGYSVICADRNLPSESPKDFGLADITNKEQTRGITRGFDVVVHLANVLKIDEILKEPRLALENNVQSTLNLLEDLRMNNPSGLFVYPSSDKIYGRPSSSIVTESCSPQPLDPYGASKLICEILIKSYHHTYGINYVIIRSGNVFGPDQRPGLFIPSVISRICRGEETITTGSLESYRNFIYVEDLCQAYRQAMGREEAKNLTFNLVSYHQQMREVAEKIKEMAREHLGKEVKFEMDEKRSRASSLESNFCLDCSLAEDVLGWGPTLDFSEAMRKTFLSYSSDKPGETGKG